jgi:hypothetical protein
MGADQDPYAKIEAFEAEVWQQTAHMQDADPITPRDPQSIYRQNKRFEIAGTDIKELRSEIAALPHGVHVGAAQVDEMIKRKRAELAVELRHTVKLTEDHGAHWSVKELGVVDTLLDRIPQDQLVGLGEINRTHIIKDRDGEPRQGPVAKGVPAATNYAKHEIGMYDAGFIDGGRRQGVTSELSGRGRTVPGMGYVDQTLAHELGHWQHVKNAAAKTKFNKVSGWDAGAPVLPSGDGWGYAATHSDEHFAELYTDAINTPEMLYRDMIDGPQAAQRAAQDRWVATQQSLMGAIMLGDPAVIAAVTAKAEAERVKMEQAAKTTSSLDAQWHLMREDVFGVTERDLALATARVHKAGADGAKLSEFQQKAKMVMTKDQLEHLTTRYGG